MNLRIVAKITVEFAGCAGSLQWQRDVQPATKLDLGMVSLRAIRPAMVLIFAVNRLSGGSCTRDLFAAIVWVVIE